MHTPVVDALVMKPIITSVVITTTKPPPLERQFISASLTVSAIS